MMSVAVAITGCAHAQQPERRIYVISDDAQGVGTALGTGGSGFRNCDKEQNECFDDCWKTEPLPYPHEKRDGAFYQYCTSECLKVYMECEKANEKKVKELKFSRVDEAIEWIRSHKAQVALGTVVVIAGVAFVITTGGSGALILAPLAL
ncbi:hypothetical protein [Vitiosangium sp. GDMCC 1.1324]|uniref:hypothetical protein n=1 Tax=Vitiosangium sp. (strain GDMCC 1.1324) TaxID=2138576 RepID=UPI000D36726C|nr:hypothetical protein [Vitiosangium sp. GDMCC 1.1324]PTL80577.1 hypothetical protein DAT35_28535 [Vitiosangium sp. GDMCC 1.1324]